MKRSPDHDTQEAALKEKSALRKKQAQERNERVLKMLMLAGDEGMRADAIASRIHCAKGTAYNLLIDLQIARLVFNTGGRGAVWKSMEAVETYLITRLIEECSRHEGPGPHRAGLLIHGRTPVARHSGLICLQQEGPIPPGWEPSGAQERYDAFMRMKNA